MMDRKNRATLFFNIQQKQDMQTKSNILTLLFGFANILFLLLQPLQS